MVLIKGMFRFLSITDHFVDVVFRNNKKAKSLIIIIFFYLFFIFIRVKTYNEGYNESKNPRLQTYRRLLEAPVFKLT